MSDDLPQPDRPPTEPPPDPRLIAILLAITVEGFLILLAWLVGLVAGKKPLATFFWVPDDIGVGAAATLPMLALFFACLRWPVGPLKQIKQVTDEIIRPFLSPCTVLDLAGIAILAGLGEEMLFRGVLQAALREWTDSPWLALGLASILFGAAHAVSLSYMVFATIMGAYLGWLWQVTENLLVVVLAHALYDFIALVVILQPAAREPRS